MRIIGTLRAVLVAGVALCAQPALAAGDVPSRTAVASGTYRITFLGIPFGTTQYNGKFDDTHYDATARFDTSGLVSIFWKAVINAKVRGTYDGARVSPALYDADYRGGKDKHQRVKLTYKNGESALFADPPYSLTKYAVTDAQKAEAVDPMSALTLILLGLKADKDNPCGTVAPIYDGRRRYDIELVPVRDERFRLSRKLFDGTAHLCQIRYRQIAGYKQKILDEGKRWPPIYGYFEDLPSKVAPGGRYVVALKVWADTDWGRVAVTLVDRALKETTTP